ncbi:hypothetical protein EN788_22345 [Mesorhizobium sp. M2D.F.Ca.ET.145.01.1.1]|uniref:hypothetical protein n=1 Tax=unclassified Mesorhizobium TaxID=325217 RepID=UPI000FCBAAEC|nr:MULTISPECIES: hypothetical protein [unclassified Mesorhizobium]TGU44658.1 hypothetical protein EN789_21895 [bacterium M00.F.Ca.ET.146.01.1.1]TGU58486.1 hypothetical protein EN791_021895 [Mesorhizobium sp. M2D.F.Ca.ET.148.01.1.1]TGU64418.1 hypothetical protein EN790_21890 [Mesorhizobium sp. M2D.F.Ca.ET.147.01.1.1]TGW09994.1 hypothetical protein EN788_22345 [Mesorhizobium sp. M2D.F.Ca.ET.145.01.1.1]
MTDTSTSDTALVERLKLWSDPAEFERIMTHWDSWRSYIKKGGGASWPRDAFESILDAFAQDGAEAAARLTAMQAELEALRRKYDTTLQCYEGAIHRYEVAEAALGWNDEPDCAEAAIVACQHNSEWLETFSNVVEGRLEDELQEALGLKPLPEFASRTWDELLDIVRERAALALSAPGMVPQVIDYEESGVSELVLTDEFHIYGETATVVVIRNAERRIVGFQWFTKDIPNPKPADSPSQTKESDHA